MLVRDKEGKRLSLKVNIDQAESLKMESGARHGVITENTATKELKLRSLVNEKLTCVPKNYKVGESTRSGFFRSDHQTISKVDIDLQHQMKPYIYDIRSQDDFSDEPHEYDALRSRKGGPLNQTQKLKRVSLSKPELEAALFRLFDERPGNEGYKISDLEARLNHPRQSLKNALRNLCNYDFQRKVYTLKYKN